MRPLDILESQAQGDDMQTQTPHTGAIYSLTLAGTMLAALGMFRLDAGKDCDHVAATYLPGYVPFTGAAR